VNVSFRTAEESDALTIVPFLRDRERINLIRVGNPVEVIKEAMHESVSNYVGEADGVVAVMWGLRSEQLLGDSAYLWMLGTTFIEEHPIHFLRYSQAAINLMRKRYRVLYGEIEVDYNASIRWLEWLGAKITPHERRLMFVLHD
jgi:hypothetical protein